MDLSTTIIGLALLTACISPFLFFEISKNNKRKKAEKAFLAHAEEKDLRISEMDFWNHSAIGLDETGKKVYYRNLRKEQDILVELAKVKKCRIIRIMRDEEGQNGTRSILDRIQLGLTENGQGKETLLEFYSPDASLTISDELKLAEKWTYLINSKIKGK